MHGLTLSRKGTETHGNVKTQTCGFRMIPGRRFNTVLLARGDFQEDSEGYREMELYIFAKLKPKTSNK